MLSENDPIIRKVWKNKSNNQKLVTIPQNTEIREGDHILISKLTLNYEQEPADLKVQSVASSMQRIITYVIEDLLDDVSRNLDWDDYIRTLRYFRHRLFKIVNDIQAEYEVDEPLDEDELEELEKQAEEVREQMVIQDAKEIEK